MAGSFRCAQDDDFVGVRKRAIVRYRERYPTLPRFERCGGALRDGRGEDGALPIGMGA